MEFMPSLAVLATYTLACAVLFSTPGPDMSLFLAKTLAGGPRAGTAAFLGATTGSIFHTLAAAAGISLLIAASPEAFLVLKVTGAIYLLWMAIDAIRNGSQLEIGANANPRESLGSIYLKGIFINLTNPKILIFFITFLPQFINSGDPNAPAKLLFLGGYFIAFTLPCGIIMILLADRLLSYLRSRPQVLRAIDWFFAAVFALFAVKIALM